IQIGLLLHSDEAVVLMPDRLLTVYVNGSAIWGGLLREAAGRELVLRVPRRALRRRFNLLQFHVSEPFVPSAFTAGSDYRKLGVALRRVWFDQVAGRPPEVDQIAGRQPPNRAPGQALRHGERLLVLRGDVRSHTGYANAIRALALLVPEHFQII